MIKLTVLYREPANREAFELFYTQNLALMERIPHVIRRQVSHVFGSPDAQTPYYRSLELYFEDRDKLDEAMTSAQGEAAGQHLMAQAAELAELYFSEVYEEAGGSTPTVVDLRKADDAPADEATTDEEQPAEADAPATEDDPAPEE